MLDQWIEQASEPNKEAVIKALLGAKEAMLGIRYRMSQMGEAAGVPVSSWTNWALIFMVICSYDADFDYTNMSWWNIHSSCVFFLFEI